MKNALIKAYYAICYCGIVVASCVAIYYFSKILQWFI